MTAAGFRSDPRTPEPPWEPWHAPPGDVVDEPWPIGTGLAHAQSARPDVDDEDEWDEGEGWNICVVAVILCGLVAAVAVIGMALVALRAVG